MAFFGFRDDDKKKDGGLPAFQSGIGLQYNRDSESPFKIDHSFLLDGVSEYFNIPNADIDVNIFGGTNNKYTIYGNIKRVSTATPMILLMVGSTFMLGLNSGKLELITNGNTGTFRTSVTVPLNTWCHFAVSIDLENTSNCKIVLDGISVAIDVNNLTSTTPTSTGQYWVGARNNLTRFFGGNINMLSVVNRVTTLIEDVEMYNTGKPKDPQDFFGSECKWFFNPDNSGSTAQFVVNDPVNSANATSVNMEDSDKTTDTPY